MKNILFILNLLCNKLFISVLVLFMFMTLDYYGLSKKPKLFRNFTGFTVSEFDDIYKKLEEKYDDYEREIR